MIAQTYPLYTTRFGRDLLVVGWTACGEDTMYPVLAPLDIAGRATICRGQDLIFRLGREVYPKPAEAVTERIPAPFPRIEGIR